MKTFKPFLILILFTLVLTACGGTGPHAVTKGDGVEYIMNLEQRGDGTFVLWLRGDSSFAYCTGDKDMYATAQKAIVAHAYVHITYRTINANEQDILSLQGCTRGGSDTTIMELLLTVEPLSGQ